MGLVIELWGQGAGVQKTIVRSPAVSRGACNPLQPARTSALQEGAGGAVAGAGVTIGRATGISVSQEAISSTASKSLSTIFKLTVQRRWSTFCTTVLFRGRRQWPQAISYVLLLYQGWGSGREISWEPKIHIRDGLRPLPPTPKNAPWYRPLIISAGSEGSRALFMAEVAWNHCLNGWKWGSKSIPGNRNRILGHPNLPWAPAGDPCGSHGTPSPLGERRNACGLQRIAHPRREPRWRKCHLFTPSPPPPEL